MLAFQFHFPLKAMVFKERRNTITQQGHGWLVLNNKTDFFNSSLTKDGVYLANARGNIFVRSLVNLIRNSFKCKLEGVGNSHKKLHHWISRYINCIFFFLYS